jgi:hypothetical protein
MLSTTSSGTIVAAVGEDVELVGDVEKIRARHQPLLDDVELFGAIGPTVEAARLSGICGDSTRSSASASVGRGRRHRDVDGSRRQ